MGLLLLGKGAVSAHQFGCPLALRWTTSRRACRDRCSLIEGGSGTSSHRSRAALSNNKEACDGLDGADLGRASSLASSLALAFVSRVSRRSVARVEHLHCGPSRRYGFAVADDDPGAGLLEREVERGELRVALAGAAAGRGAVVLVEGPPGIGKTRLLDDAAVAAARLGIGVLRARAHELERRVPFAVVRGLLEPVLAETDAAPASAGTAVARLLGGTLGAPGGAEEAAGVVHGLYALTAALAARAPRALLVDDVQWADVASVRFLLYLARRAESLALALIVGVRGEEALELVARLVDAGSVQRLRPAALSADAVGVVLAERLGREAGPALRDSCLRATGGNALLVVELARALAAVSPEDDAAAVARVGRLAPEAVTRSVTLRLAAVSE